jgi:hypothetical protein
VLKKGLARPLHIGKHSLAEMPTKQFIYDAVRIVRISAHAVQYSTIDLEVIGTEICDLVAILDID